MAPRCTLPIARFGLRPKVTSVGARIFAAFFFVALFRSAAVAHEGHDLEPARTSATSPALTRLVTNSEAYELVAVLEGANLTIYLDRFEDNSPVTDANINVMIDDESGAAQPTAAGTYVVASKRLTGSGVLALLFDIRAPEGDDLLVGKLPLPNRVTSDIPSDTASWTVRVWSYLRHGAEDHLTLMSFMLLAGLILGIAMRRSRVHAMPILVLLTLTLVIAAVGIAHAHEGPEDGVDTRLPTMGDTARRLPDGGVFVPKPMQRILDVRTVVAKPETLSKSDIFVGRVIANPNRSGLVQSITGGRVIAPDEGLPRLGQAIVKGDVLVLIEPPMAISDRTTISERMGDLEQQIAVAETKLKRLRDMAERGVSPQALVVETEAELQGLYRRRDVVRDSRVAPEVLRAPIDGVIGISRVVAGQVVQAQDVLFQIVDPNSLWIEAFDYGDTNPATLKNATAIGPGNVPVSLAFQGWSRTLQQQATLLQFSIVDPPPAVRVGQPVTVTAQRNETATGIIVERDAIVRGGNGEMLVWRHAEPERFEPHPVRIEPFDATRVLIAAGVANGDRIVVRGAELINQIR